MPSTCEFQLNNPNAVYYSGETVSGTIILKTTSAKEVRGKCFIKKNNNNNNNSLPNILNAYVIQNI